MRSQRRVPGRSRQVLSIPKRYMVSIVAHVALGKAEVDDVYLILVAFGSSDQEVIWLDIPVEQAVLVQLFNSTDHLEGYQAGRFEVELALALLKQVLQARPEQVHDYDVELILGVCLIRSDVVELRHVRYITVSVSSRKGFNQQ